jgi:hypothetical protein
MANPKSPPMLKRSTTNFFEIKVTHILLRAFIAARAFPVLLSSALRAQVFAPVPAMSFTKGFEGANPLPQTLMISNVGATFNFGVTSSTSSGGSWLTVIAGQNCTTCAAPTPLKITANPVVTLAAGTYLGQVVVTSQFGGVERTVPVSLTITAASVVLQK